MASFAVEYNSMYLIYRHRDYKDMHGQDILVRSSTADTNEVL